MRHHVGVRILIVSLLLLAACAPSATPTAAPTKPAEKPPAAATAKPAEKAPAAQATAKPAEKPAEKAAAKPAADEWGVVTVRKGDAIKIGLGATLSGENAPLGQDIRNGATLALEDSKDIKGFKIDLVAEDDQCSGDGGRAAAEKLAANQQMLAVLGMMCSSASTPAVEVFNRAHIVMVSASSTAPALTARPTPIFNRVCWNDSVQGAFAAKWAKDKLGVNSAAVIHDGSAYGQGLADVFRRNFEQAGGKVTSFDGITVGEKDFRPVLTRIAANRPQLLYFGGFIAEGALLVSQRSDVGLSDAKLMGADGINSSKYIEAAGGAAEGSYASSADVPSSPKVKEFEQRVVQRFGAGADKLGPFHTQAYDGMKLILDKVNEVAKDDGQGNLAIGRKALADAVRGTKGFQGLTGSLSCDANGDCGLADIAVFQVKQGKFEKVS